MVTCVIKNQCVNENGPILKKPLLLTKYEITGVNYYKVKLQAPYNQFGFELLGGEGHPTRLGEGVAL